MALLNNTESNLGNVHNINISHVCAFCIILMPAEDGIGIKAVKCNNNNHV